MRPGNVRSMRRLKRAIAWLLLALWAPASSHSLLEQGGLIHQDAPAAGTSHPWAGDHDGADGLCRWEGNDEPVAVPVLPPSPVPPVELASPCELFLTADSTDSPGPAPPANAPPELSRSWQFAFRAALPIRAPSGCC
jgi:hypothetical protein